MYITEITYNEQNWLTSWMFTDQLNTILYPSFELVYKLFKNLKQDD